MSKVGIQMNEAQHSKEQTYEMDIILRCCYSCKCFCNYMGKVLISSATNETPEYLSVAFQ